MKNSIFQIFYANSDESQWIRWLTYSSFELCFESYVNTFGSRFMQIFLCEFEFMRF